jgi:allantoin racemase
VLGCAGMADLCAEIAEAIGAPVIEGVTAAVKLVESLVSLGLATAKRGEYAPPLAKHYDGLLEPFSPLGKSAQREGPVVPALPNR